MKNKNLLFSKLVNRETVLYGIFGVMTSVLNVVLFRVLLLCDWDYKVANIVTLIIVKLAAYLCNKNFVFRSRTGSLIGLCREFGRFVVARGLTMLIDYFGLIMMVEMFDLDKVLSKCFLTVLVIVLNYFIGKKHVFKNSR